MAGDVPVLDLLKTFEKESSKYDDVVVRVIPHYTDALKYACENIPCSIDADFSLLDIAAGTGTFILSVKEKFPNVRADYLDFSDGMQKIAKNKLCGLDSIRFFKTDFFLFESDHKYDVIFTSFFLHNFQRYEKKIQALQKISSMLEKNGLFIMADILVFNIKGKCDQIEKWYRNFLIDKNGLDGALNHWIPLLREEDYPSTITDLFEMGKIAGFPSFDVVYLNDNVAVIIFSNQLHDRRKSMQIKTAFKDKYYLLWRKMDILCHGIAEDNEGILSALYVSQNPHDTQRTGNTGLQVKLDGGELALNVAVYKGFCKTSPYHLIKTPSGLALSNDEDNSITPVICPSTAPKWYCTPVGDNRIAGDLVLLEGDFTAITSITNGCIYFNKGKPCAFCALGPDITEPDKIISRKESLKKALSMAAIDPQIQNIHLTGGNTFDADRGALNYLEFIDAIRQVNPNINIAIEIPPPQVNIQRDVFSKLKSAGIHSITINIEFWDDTIRQKLMPAKGAITKDEYISAFKTALEFFGKDKVSCGFIVGIEPLEKTKEGADFLTELGIIVEVYPFKPNDKSMMERDPICSLDHVVEMSIYANTRMQMHEIHPENCSGCAKCGACGITQELTKILNLEGELLCTQK